MIVEIADFLVQPENQRAFSEAIARAADTVLARAKGYQQHRILACHETPGRFVLLVHWETTEDHTVGFRESPAFASWRAIIAPYFAQPPFVEHFDVIASSEISNTHPCTKL